MKEKLVGHVAKHGCFNRGRNGREGKRTICASSDGKRRSRKLPEVEGINTESKALKITINHESLGSRAKEDPGYLLIFCTRML